MKHWIRKKTPANKCENIRRIKNMKVNNKTMKAAIRSDTKQNL